MSPLSLAAMDSAHDSKLTPALWNRLRLFLDRGGIEIDTRCGRSTGIPSASVPRRYKKKDPPSPRLRRTVWLFLGSETTGQRAAIIHIMVECAMRHGHNPEARLNGVLERLPTMTNQHALTVLLPANWQSGPGAWASVKRSPSCDSRSMFGFGILDSGL